MILIEKTGPIGVSVVDDIPVLRLSPCHNLLSRLS